jgi:transcriptional regulator with XRE-family HTH domain
MTNNLSARKPLFDMRRNKSVGERPRGPDNYAVGMADKDPWNLEIAARLRAAMAECEIDTTERLAEILHEPSSRVRNWVNGTSRPMAADARRLKGILGVTMDWLYDGDAAGLPGGKYTRLSMALAGAPIPRTAAEPEARVVRQEVAEVAPRRAKVGAP